MTSMLFFPKLRAGDFHDSLVALAEADGNADALGKAHLDVSNFVAGILTDGKLTAAIITKFIPGPAGIMANTLYVGDLSHGRTLLNQVCRVSASLPESPTFHVISAIVGKSEERVAALLSSIRTMKLYSYLADEPIFAMLVDLTCAVKFKVEYPDESPRA